MHTDHYEDRLPENDLLSAEARAVIDADFEEIHPIPPRKNFITQMREGWVWIRKRLHRA
jgi:hypothetical protein